jgi:hypothetical protein
VFYDLAVVIEPENIYTHPIAIPRPLLMAMQYDVIAFGDDSLKMDALTRVFFRHPLKIVDERLLAVGDPRDMLDINIARTLLDGLHRLNIKS